MSNRKPYRGILWIARIFGTFIVAFVLFMLVQEYVEELRNPSVSPGQAFLALISAIDGMLFEAILLCIAAAGLILAYWREGLGGSITLVCSAWLCFRLSSDQFNYFLAGAFLIVSIPCILYIIYWWKTFRRA